MSRFEYVQQIKSTFYPYTGMMPANVYLPYVSKVQSASTLTFHFESLVFLARYGVTELLDLFPGPVTGRMVCTLRHLLGLIAKAARWPNLRTLPSISNSEPNMKAPIKKPCSPIHTDIHNPQSGTLPHKLKKQSSTSQIQIVTMYSDIILQTFDAFQAQQGNLIKAQHDAKEDTRHGSEERHRLVNSSSRGHTLSIRSLSFCHSQHGERGIGYSGAAAVGSPS